MCPLVESDSGCRIDSGSRNGCHRWLIPSYLIKVVGPKLSGVDPKNKIDSKQIGFWHSLQPLGHWLLHGQPKIEKNKALV